MGGKRRCFNLDYPFISSAVNTVAKQKDTDQGVV